MPPRNNRRVQLKFPPDSPHIQDLQGGASPPAARSPSPPPSSSAGRSRSLSNSKSSTMKKDTKKTTSPSPPPRANKKNNTKASEPAKSAPAKPNQTSEIHYEFNGPIGALGITIGLPVVCYLLVAVCNAKQGCVAITPFETSTSRLKAQVNAFWERGSIATGDAAVAYLIWFVGCAALHLLLPGARIKGTKLKTGEQLTYKINGLYTFLLTTFGLAYLAYVGAFKLSYAYHAYVPLLTASVAFSYALSIYVYAMSFVKGKLLAEGGQTGNVLYDFFIGRELNPRIGSFDWKEFCELVPGLTLWVLLDMACCHAAYLHSGGGGWASLPASATATPWSAASAVASDVLTHIPIGLLLVTAFHWWYVFDALYNERSILTTMDITTDGFGFMLAFGDLAWVPFTYSLPARYLADRVIAGDSYGTTPPWLSVASVVLFFAGYSIFRGANGTKDLFRRNPDDPRVKHIKVLPTKRGTKLMVSGWWGMARHINYTGDWVLGLAWCLPCGFDRVIPYFYAVYFAVLLVHRDLRDEEMCEKKYGKDWATYKQKVPYRFIPGVY